MTRTYKPLPAKRAEAIASLVNSLFVADDFCTNAAMVGDTEKYARWHANRVEVATILRDQHGITILGMEQFLQARA